LKIKEISIPSAGGEKQRGVYQIFKLNKHPLSPFFAKDIYFDFKT